MSVSLPEGLTYIGNAAFQNCSNLASVRIPGSVSKIGYSAYALCPRLDVASRASIQAANARDAHASSAFGII